MNLINELREHIVHQYLKGVEPPGFDEDYDLIANGILDSLALMNLITQVEQTYGITFGEYDITPETFETITRLARYIDSRREAEASPEPVVEPAPVARPQPTLDEPIALIGLGCRFPGGADTPEQFWELLRTGVDTAAEIPAERWDVDQYYDPNPATPGKMYVRTGSFLRDIDQFDPHFFGIAPLEAVTIDPQQRLLLEVAWEALERAGIPADTLRDTLTGVFSGMFWDDYSVANLYLDQPEQLNSYRLLSNLRGLNAGRLAYVLGVQGPAMQVDTACSASLLAVHLASQALRNQECDLALAGGVDLNLSPERTIALCNMQALATDGRCKTFDNRADGFGQGEGCGMVVLKRLSDAVAAGDPILAVIRGSAVNHDGRSSGLTVPNGVAQKRLIQQAWHNGAVEPDAVHYFETHGTGTPLGDPTELNAISKLIGSERKSPLYIGSVKGNIGHLSSAAGVASLIKVVLSLQHQQLPPQPNFEQPNPRIPWDDAPFTVPTELTPWPATNGQPRLAGISSFGLTGTNVHVVVAEAPAQDEAVSEQTRPQHLLTLSGKTEQALADQVAQYQRYLKEHGGLDIGDVCYTSNVGRVHFEQRLGVVAAEMAELQQKLAAYQSGELPLGMAQGVVPAEKPKVAFLFPGQGPQYATMGRELYETQPLFREIMDDCDQILQSYWDKSLLEILYGADEASNDQLLDEATYAQPALFAIEYALAKLWQSWGIEPEVVIGHSMGEYAAACFAGVFSLEDGLKLIAERGRLMQEEAEAGQMVAVLASVEEVAPVIEPFASEVSIGVINTPQNLVLSGRPSGVEQAVKALEEAGLETRQLKIYVSSHSPLMDKILDSFESVVAGIACQRPEIKVVSNLTGTVVSDELTSSDYWRQHLRQSVQFARGMATLEELGIDTFIEVGPKPTLLGLGQQCLATESSDDFKSSDDYNLSRLWLPSLYPKQSGDWEQMLASLGQLHVRGGKIDWATLHEPYGYRKVSLPTYPFQRKRYWIDKPKTGRRSGEVGHPLLGEKFESPTTSEIHFENELSADYPAYLSDHQVYEQVVVPATAYLEMALSAGHQIAEGEPFELRQISFQQPLVLPTGGESQKVQLVASPQEAGYRWQIFSQNENREWRLHTQGEVVTPAEAIGFEGLSLKKVQARCSEEVSLAEYEALVSPGLYFGPDFQGFEQLFRGEGEALGLIQLPDNLSVAEYQLHPVLLDCCLRVGGIIETEEVDSPYLPFSCEAVRFYPVSGLTRVWSHVQSRGEVAGTRQLDITLYNEGGQVVAELIGFGLRQANRQAITGSTLRTDWLYQLAWLESTLPQSSPYADAPGRWLIVSEATELAQGLAALLQAEGAEVVINCPTEVGTTNDMAQLSGVIYLAGESKPLGRPDRFSKPVRSAVPETALAISTQVLELVQALIKAEMTSDLWLVTTDEVEQSVLWGLGRTLMWEHPQLNSRCIEMTGETPVETLFETIWHADGENQIRLEGEQCQVARLERYTVPSTGSGNDNPIKSDRSYLITGGLGGLGLKVAEWLVEQGATQLVLSSRRGALAEPVEAVITELEAAGAMVQVVKADVSQEEDVARLLEKCQQFAPLAGIIHAAGVLDDGMVRQQTPGRFAKVFAPKVQGSWYLHEYSRDIPLDFFVCFSSQSSLLGNGGQSNYAAANAFMDRLVAYRQAHGLPGLSINWGGWSEVGLAKDLMAQQTEVISPQQGVALLGALLSQDISQVGVLPTNWTKFRRQYDLPLLSQLGQQHHSSKSNNLLHRLREISADKRQSFLKEYIQEQVAYVSGTSPEINQSWHELGLDSLMITELKNRLDSKLKVTIPLVKMMQQATTQAIMQLILNQLEFASTSPTDVQPPETGANETLLAEIYQQIPQLDITVEQQQYRQILVEERWVVDFASCNYLGLDLHPDISATIPAALEAWGTHPSWSRAVAYPDIYNELEQALAELMRAPTVLVFPSVSLLHLGVLPVLAEDGGVILKDISAHNTIAEGCVLAGASGAEVIEFRHNDLQDLTQKLAQYPLERTKIITIDGVYSMSGWYPPLPAYVELAKRYNATIYMDDAHGMGVIGENPTENKPYGERGNGLVNYYGLDYVTDRIIYVAGLSKSYSSYGAFITCMDEEMKQRVKMASTFGYSGPSPVASLASALAGLKVNEQEGEQRRQQIYHLSHKLVTGAQAIGFEVKGGNYFPIVCVKTGKPRQTARACQILWDYGILITPGIYPLVPLNEGVLRFSVTAANSEAEVDQAIRGLEAVWERLQQNDE